MAETSTDTGGEDHARDGFTWREHDAQPAPQWETYDAWSRRVDEQRNQPTQAT
jgi:hypothetical protein